MSRPWNAPAPRRSPVCTGGAVRIAAGAGLVATLLLCQGAGEPVPVLKKAGEMAAPQANWQPASQPTSQPATQPDTQPATQPAATQPAVPMLQTLGKPAAPQARWEKLPV